MCICYMVAAGRRGAGHVLQHNQSDAASMQYLLPGNTKPAALRCSQRSDIRDEFVPGRRVNVRITDVLSYSHVLALASLLHGVCTRGGAGGTECVAQQIAHQSVSGSNLGASSYTTPICPELP